MNKETNKETNKEIKEIEEFRKESRLIAQEVQRLDEKKNQLITRLAEIQGVVKYLKSKEEKASNKN